MSDQLPNLIGGGGYEVEAQPVIVVDANGNAQSGSSGSSDPLNSTIEALDANGEFIGEWVTN